MAPPYYNEDKNRKTWNRDHDTTKLENLFRHDEHRILLISINIGYVDLGKLLEELYFINQ